MHGVGDFVGDEVGVFVGDVVGDCVGDCVGDVVGDCVGDFVGDEVGTHVGSQYSSQTSLPDIGVAGTLHTNPDSELHGSPLAQPMVSTLQYTFESLNTSQL